MASVILCERKTLAIRVRVRVRVRVRIRVRVTYLVREEDVECLAAPVPLKLHLRRLPRGRPAQR